MKFIPTMNFNGQCREAMEMYREAFGGKVTALLTYGEANDPAYTLTEEQKNWIYHGELTFRDQRIIMSDHVDMKFETCYTRVCFQIHNHTKSMNYQKENAPRMSNLYIRGEANGINDSPVRVNRCGMGTD